jgi:S-DNA-T family DNA segregation ATPase FtsK/SpoIIIE
VQVAFAPAAVVIPDPPASGWAPRARLTGFVARRSPAARAALAAWERRGIRIATLDAYAADPSVSADGPLVLTGEPDEWQRHWRVLAEVRADHDLVVDAACGVELRMLTGSRALPPYCEPGRGRAWLMSAGADPVRIVLSTPDVPPDRRGEVS